MAEWRPIETAPKDGTRLLLWCVGGGGQQEGIEIPGWNIGRWWNADEPHTSGRSGWALPDAEDWPDFVDATAWQPLPPPPGDGDA